MNESRQRRSAATAKENEMSLDENTRTALTVKEALARIPDHELECVACDMLDELNDELDIYVPKNSEELKVILKHLRWMVERALNLLEPVTIEEKEEEDGTDEK
jgi:hypothetical protein